MRSVLFFANYNRKLASEICNDIIILTLKVIRFSKRSFINIIPVFGVNKSQVFLSYTINLARNSIVYLFHFNSENTRIITITLSLAIIIIVVKE